MKKITKTILILAIATVAITPVQTFAFTQEVNPSWGATIQNIHNVVDPKFDDMQNQINALKAQCQNAGASGNEQRMANIEARVSVLERAVNILVNQISNALQQIIKFITK